MEIKCLKKSATQVTRYDYGEYYVDVVKTFAGNGSGYYEAFLGNEDYGIQMMMFGVNASSRKEFLSLIENNIDNEIEMYREKYED